MLSASRSIDEVYEAVCACFQRVEQVRHCQAHVHGSLSNATRKNVEKIALGPGQTVCSLQYSIGQSPWAGAAVTAIHQGLIGETLGEDDGIALIDQSSTMARCTGSTELMKARMEKRGARSSMS